MSIQNAMDFIQIHMERSETRAELYKLDSVSEFSEWLSERDIFFKWVEFEESVNLLHVKCQSHEEADVLLHRVDWFRVYWSSLTNS